MDKNIGRRIEELSSIMMTMGIIISIVAGFYLIFGVGIAQNSTIGFVAGLIVIVFGCIASWISHLLLSGFGELIEDTRALRIYVENIESAYYVNNEEK